MKSLCWKVRIELFWIVWSNGQYVAPAVAVSGGQKNGRSRKERDKWKKKRRKGERQRQILSHASSVSPSLLFSCWTLTFHLDHSLTIRWMPPNKASLLICPPLQKKDRKRGGSKRDKKSLINNIGSKISPLPDGSGQMLSSGQLVSWRRRGRSCVADPAPIYLWPPPPPPSSPPIWPAAAAAV